MPLYDFQCTGCGHEFEAVAPSEIMTDGLRIKCPECIGKAYNDPDGVTGLTAKRVFRNAPRISKPGSDQDVANLQRSFRERFFKKDIDDVRHKHGAEIDDSIRGAEVAKIRRGLAQKTS